MESLLLKTTNGHEVTRINQRLKKKLHYPLEE
jgi:hypothetical protein